MSNDKDNKIMKLLRMRQLVLGLILVGGTTIAAVGSPASAHSRSQAYASTQWVNAAQTWSDFAQTADNYFYQGLRADWVSTTLGANGQVLYSGIFHSDQGSDAQWINIAAPWASFAQTADDEFNQGLRLVSISTVTGLDGQVLYTGVFRGGQGDGGQWVNQAQGRQDFFNTMDYWQGQGLHLIATATARGTNGQILYTGLFRSGQGTDGETREASYTWGSFAYHTDYEFNQGWRVISMATTTEDNGWVRYSAVYRADTGTQWILSARSWADFAAADGSYFEQGLRLVSLGLTTGSDGQVLYTGVWRSN